ncbi:MAG: carboxymuconolactone decarboxylase family protein [Gammaproteobacteria bacterium AqS3]|nr:carboxymuconolactone decarboxylase family protein [Gammaproteobacteria bacterium AqS3]
MPLVKPLAEQQIEASLLEQLQFFKGPLGVIPNSVKTMAHRPAVAAAFTALNIAVMQCRGQVTPEFKRLLGYATSFTSGCRYCQAHTILGAERFGSTPERLESVWDFEHSEHFTEAEKAALAYARTAAGVPNGVDESIADALCAHWSDADIVEITAVIALFGFLNRWNDSMGSALEDLPIEAGERHLAETSGWEVGKHR